MGLWVCVGLLSRMIENESEFVDAIRAEFAVIDAMLRARGLSGFVEPEDVSPPPSRAGLDAVSYSSLHYLRRAYAHIVAYGELPSLPDGAEAASRDPVVDMISLPEHHLLWHSDADGYYVPVDFEEAIDDQGMPGWALGSSVRLRDELAGIAPFLGIRLEDGRLSDAEAARINDLVDANAPWFVELMVWLALFEAARLSIEHRTAIVFC